MMSTGYPSTELPLLTPDIAQIMGFLPIPVELIKSYGLYKYSVFTDLVGVETSSLPPESIKPLGKYIAGYVQNHSSKLYMLENPIRDGYLSFHSLCEYLSARSANALMGLELEDSYNAASLSVATVATTPGLGARGILEVLSIIHSIGEVNDRYSDQLKVDINLRNAADKLSKKIWSTEIHVTDPRIKMFRSGQHKLHFAKNMTLIELCNSLADLPMQLEEARAKEIELNRIAILANKLTNFNLGEEMQSVLQAIDDNPRRARIITKRLGFDGSEPLTLEEVGKLENVTRERIRQIEKKFVNSLEECKPIWTPILDRTLIIIEQNLPFMSNKLRNIMVENTLSEQEYSIDAIIRQAELFDKHIDFQHYKDTGIVSKPIYLQTVDEIISHAITHTRHWGATQISTLREELINNNISVNDTGIIAALNNRIDFCWLDEADGWFWLKTVSKNRILNYVKKIMSVAGTIDLGDLRNGTGRWHRVNGYRLPKKILKALCISTGLYTAENEKIIGGSNLPDWNDLLAKGEREIVSILFENDYAMRRADLENKVLAKGIPRSSFYIYIVYSPVIERYAPGVYGLRGAPISAAQIESLIPLRHKSSKLFLDDGWTSDGNLWAGYMVSKSSQATGVMSVPSTIKELIKGTFRLQTSDGTFAGSITIRDSNMWGLSPFFRKWGIEDGDYIVIVFNTNIHTATIHAGDIELMDRFQNQDVPLIDNDIVKDLVHDENSIQ